MDQKRRVIDQRSARMVGERAAPARPGALTDSGAGVILRLPFTHPRFSFRGRCPSRHLNVFLFGHAGGDSSMH